MREQQEVRRAERERAELAKATSRAVKRRSIASCTALEAEWGGGEDANELAVTLEMTLLKGLSPTFHRRVRGGAAAGPRARPALHSLAEQASEDAEADPQQKGPEGGASETQSTAASSFRGEVTPASGSGASRPPRLPCPRPRIGETHTLVRGLCSYRSLTLPLPRPPSASRCPDGGEKEEAQGARLAQVPRAGTATVSKIQRGSLPRRWGITHGNKTAGHMGDQSSRLCGPQETDKSKKTNPLRRLLERAKPDRAGSKEREKEREREKSKDKEADKKDKQQEKKEKEQEKDQKKKEKKKESKKEKGKEKKGKAKRTTEDETGGGERSLSLEDVRASSGSAAAGVCGLPAGPMPASPHGLPRVLQSSVFTTARALRSVVLTAASATKRERSRSSSPRTCLGTRIPAPVPVQTISHTWKV